MKVSQQFDNSLELIQIPSIKQGKAWLETFDGHFPFSYGVWTLKKAKLIRAETLHSVNPHCAHWDKFEKLCILGPVSV